MQNGPDACAIQAVLPSTRAWPLHDTAATRQIESAAMAANPAHALMQRAGLAVARLAVAVAPHGRRVWVAAGPGNNGGDALVAATHLHQWGWQVQVGLLAAATSLPADAAHALGQAQAAGVPIAPGLPARLAVDLCLDGLLGLGATRAPAGVLAEAVQALNAQDAPVLAIDLPTGLHADHDKVLGPHAVRASHTLALLTLKPGLFTGAGRDHAGRIWLAALEQADGAPEPGCSADLQADRLSPGPIPVSARLAGPWLPPARRHVQHKGSFGDLLVLGGASGMAGAALLCARAGLAAGAGRVWLARLTGDTEQADALRPELMPRSAQQMMQPAVLANATLVLGCGGGQAVAEHVCPALAHAARLVLDADALNALSTQAQAWPMLAARARPTVLTPHPLEAARLLGCSTAQVQADRLGAASALADRSQATVLLKGSGSVVAAPGCTPVIVPTGNARLGSGGTGDVLAGWLGAWLGIWAAQDDPQAAFRSACASAWLHGHAAEQGDQRMALRAGDLIEAMTTAVAQLPQP